MIKQNNMRNDKTTIILLQCISAIMASGKSNDLVKLVRKNFCE